MVGQTLGHYKILELLGKGGMGEVYRAEDTTLDREVAIKILPPELAESQERLDRFQREAKTLAALDHPNIVHIHTVEEADGVHFLTMQLVEGKSLSQLIPKGGLPLERIFDITTPLADALAAAHERGVTHRDLKPANIMVSDDERVKVLDFGLAKLTRPISQAEATALPTEPLTEEGRIVGTMPYMSPEQLEGQDTDPRSDIFSLGVILFEMATGARPFQGKTSASLVSSILRDTPLEIDRLRSDLPHDLARIIRRCLEKNPERRFQDAKDVRNEIADLRRELDSASSPSGVQITGAQHDPDQRRRRLLLVALGGLSLTMIIAAGVKFANHEPPGRVNTKESVLKVPVAPRIVVLPFENLGPIENEDFTAGITEEITSRLAMVQGLQVISRNSAIQYAATGKTTREIGDELAVQYLLEGTVRWGPGTDGISRVRITPQLIRVADDSHIWAQSYEHEFDDIFAIQSEIAAQVVDRLDLALLEKDRAVVEARPTDNFGAYQAYLRAGGLRGYGDRFCKSADESARLLRDAVELDSRFYQAWARLSIIESGYYAHCPERSQANAELAREALAHATALAPDSWEVFSANIRFAQQVERDYPRAFGYLESAGPRIASDAELVMMRGVLLRRMGRWLEAIADFKQASELDPRDKVAPLRVASAYMYLHRYGDANRFFDRTIAIGPGYEYAYQRKAWNLWLWRGDLTASRQALELYPGSPSGLMEWAWFWQMVYERDIAGALERLESLPGEWVDTDLDIYPKALLAGQAWELMGEADRAREDYKEARRLLEELMPESGGANAKVLRAMGMTLAGLGQAKEAIARGQESVALSPIETDPYFGSTDLLRMALIYTQVGRVDEAIGLLEQLLEMPSLISVAMLELDPRWRPLGDDPRFQALLERYD